MTFTTINKTMCSLCYKYVNKRSILQHNSLHTRDMKESKDGTLAFIINDAKPCPRCGFSATFNVCDAETLKVLRITCASKFCLWNERQY